MDINLVKNNTSKIAIFIHAAILERTKSRIFQYLDIIKNTELIEQVDFIYILFIGNNEIPINLDELTLYNINKIKLIHISNNLEDYEVFSLQFLYNFCKKNLNYKILYLHTKGVHLNQNICIEDQIEYMLYFNIVQWKTCIYNLIDNDTTGCDLRICPTMHYSGNFWWSTALHISSLIEPISFRNLEKYPNPLNSVRHNDEFWLCYYKDKKHKSLWDCGISCYERHLHRYTKENYVKENLRIVF